MGLRCPRFGPALYQVRDVAFLVTVVTDIENVDGAVAVGGCRERCAASGFEKIGLVIEKVGNEVDLIGLSIWPGLVRDEIICAVLPDE